MIVYDTAYNPCMVDNMNRYEGPTCFAPMELYNNVKLMRDQEAGGVNASQSMLSVDAPQQENFWIFSGSIDGQLLMLNKTELKWKMMQQASLATQNA